MKDRPRLRPSLILRRPRSFSVRPFRLGRLRIRPTPTPFYWHPSEMALKSRIICIPPCQEAGQSSLGSRRIFHHLKNFRRHFVHKELTNKHISWISTFVRGFTICSCAGRDLSKSGKWSLPAELLDAATSLPYISLDGYGVHTAPVKQAKICNWPWFWRWIVQTFERLGV